MRIEGLILNLQFFPLSKSADLAISVIRNGELKMASEKLIH